MKLRIFTVFAALFIANLAGAQTFTPEMKKAQCDSVVSACRYAWNAYMAHAAGFDEIKPLSLQGRNWYHTSLLMTPVDAFDTFILLGMKKEADEAKQLILSKLSFDLDLEVQFFEITIRHLGSLISAFELTGDLRFIWLAEDLGRRMLPVFASPTGMPYRYVNLKTGKTRGEISNPAEIGSCLMEFGKLTQYTSDTVFYQRARKAQSELFKRRSRIDLPGTFINVNTGQWTDPDSHIGACIDSYFEYLYKSWRLFGDKDCRKEWEVYSVSIKKYLPVKTERGTFMTHVNMETGQETVALYGALDAFIAGLMAYSGDIEAGMSIQDANYFLWQKGFTEPEAYNFRKDSIEDPQYVLRPENIESCFYLYRLTSDPKYLHMGKRMVDDILVHCRAAGGFAALKNAVSGEKKDNMESFFFAETLKYAYLLFALEETFDLSKWVFTTEAHPMRTSLR